MILSTPKTGFCLALLLCLVSSPAHAEDTDARAMELYDNGVILYDEGRYEDAIVAWESAYRLSERQELLYNIANAEERLGRYQDALDHLNRYRAHATTDERGTLDRRISNLERRLEDRALVVNEIPLPAPIPSASAVPAPAPLVPSPPPRRGHPASVALYTAGGVGLAAGLGFGSLAFSARNEAEDLCVAGRAATWCPSQARDAIERDRSMSLFADVGWGVAIGGAIGGTVAMLLPRRDRNPMEISLMPSPRATTVRVAGVF